ncbi:MAG: DUF1127 domain-containing protein [Alphaproteobacteria bacterium]
MSEQCIERPIAFDGGRRSHAPRTAPWLVALLDWIERRLERHRQRQELQGLDSRMLRDIGLSQADLRRELNKPFWRA